jgi:uncharacterized protein (TIGR02147 family)
MGRNNRYSLRAFARDLDLSPSRLSRILNSKEGLSEKSAKKISDRLFSNHHEKEFFVTLVLTDDARSASMKKHAREKLLTLTTVSSLKILDSEVFRAISDWYHYVILEMTKLNQFKYRLDWIAKKLGLHSLVAQQAIQRLLDLGLLKHTDDGYLVETESDLTTTDNIPSEAIRSYHQQILGRASEAVTFQTVDERDYSALTFAINREERREISIKIRRLENEIVEYLKNSPYKHDRHDVYTLGLYLFRQTEKDSL